MKDIELQREIEDFERTIESLKTSFQMTTKMGLERLCKRVFEKYPEVETFSVRGYTPYFNDGETCEYSLDVDSACVNGLQEYDLDQAGDYPTEGTEAEIFNLKRALEEFKEIIETLGEEDFRSIFGDHKEMIVVRETGISIEDYCGHD